MLSQKQAQELFSLFEKYNSALHSVAQDEKEKLNALLSNSLPRIEHAISVAQANAKQVESFESKRILLQTEFGCADATLSQLIELFPASQKPAFTALLKQFERYIDEIKYTNSKSISVARANITQLNPNAAILQPSADTLAPSTNNPYEAAMNHQAPNHSIFKTTI